MTSTKSNLTVAAVQMRSNPQDVEGNLSKGAASLERAADKGASLTLFPELFNVGYFIGPELFELWEESDGRTVTWMRGQAVRHRMVVAGGIAERRGDRLFDTLFIAEPDGRLHRYAKRQPFKTELAAFDQGQDESIIETSVGRIGCAICSDINWGVSVLKPLAGQVDLLLIPHASSAPKWLARRMWRQENKRRRPGIAGTVRAIGAPMLQAGLIGEMQRYTRLVGAYLYGGTWVTSPEGEALANIPFDQEGEAIASVTPGSTGGEPSSQVFRDPGFGRDLMDCLLVTPPNLRPRRAQRASSDLIDHAVGSP